MDNLLQGIILNFSAEFDKFRAKKPDSLIQQWFTSKGVKNPAVLKGFKDSMVIAAATSTKGDGPGIVQYSNKTVYIGEISGGRKNGEGCRSYPGNGIIYLGQYTDDLKNGKGKLIDLKKNQEMFNGQWLNDKRNGLGELRKDECSYKGNYVDDVMEGKGVQQWSNGNVYEGDFKGDLRTGRGTMRFENGDVYEGQFLAGKMQGEGTYTWRNGERYVGEFRDGIMFGDGKIDYPMNVSARGIFEGTSTRSISYGLTGEFGKY